MSDFDSPYRPEAVEFHERPAGPGPLLDLDRRWVSALYRLVLALLAVGTVAGATVRIDGRTLFEVLF